MEESQKSTSRKRKQSSNSNPFAGILTRHKSQKFFFHHNRSGKSRSFPNPNLPNNQRLNVINGNDDDDDDEIYHVPIKDLRARRVFSKPPKSENGVGKNLSPKSDSELIVSKSVENGVKFDGNGVADENPNLSVIEKCDSGVQFDGEGLNGGNPNLNLSTSEECANSEVELKEGQIEGSPNPNLLISQKRANSEVELKEGPIEGNPNLSVEEKSADFTVECLNGENPSFLKSENSSDYGVDLEKIQIEENPNLSDLEKFVDLKNGCLNDENPNLSIEESDAKVDMSPNLNAKNLKGLNGEQFEEDVLTTPPDAVVLVRNADSRSKRISPSRGGSAEGKKSFSNSRRNLVLNPCSKMKVFKAPNSFSYRRLLPFLMDIAKDAPSAPKVNQRIKIETELDEKRVISSSQESIIDHSKVDEKPQDSAVACETELLLDSKTNDLNVQQTAPCAPIDSPIEMSQETPSTDEQLRTPLSSYFKDEEVTPDGQVSSNDIAKSGDTCSIAKSDLAAPVHSPQRSPEPAKEEATRSSPSHLSLGNDKECSTEVVEFKSEASSVSVLHSPLKLEAVVSADEHKFGVANGILKKNPRGCRGICNCLNCSSFRLNAEKAFEFSRNQMLDTEELVTDLMKELTNLRCMLNKSVNGTDDKAIVPVHEVQEICRRASNAEDIARSRLSQMKEDLHCHCRIKPLQRPRVAFSSSVNEKTIE